MPVRWVGLTAMGASRRMARWPGGAFLVCGLFLVGVCVWTPGHAFAQETTGVSGLGAGARDSARVDWRVGGVEARYPDTRIRDQEIGWEEKRIRRERREAQRETAARESELRRARYRKEADDRRDARVRENARILEKKKKTVARQEQ